MKTLSLHLLGNGMALVLLTALAAGCVTPALWRGTAARQWKPELPDQLLLRYCTNQQPEIAILFKQCVAIQNTYKYRPVAWGLGQSPTNLFIGTKAVKQFTNTFSASWTIPVFPDDAVPADVCSTPPGYAVWNCSKQNLTIHLNGYPSAPYPLPVTYVPTKSGWRIGLLPLAVATDAAIVCAMILAVGGSGYH